MDTKITARHFHASPQLKDFVTSRLSKLERLFTGINNVHVVLLEQQHNTPDSRTFAEIKLNAYKSSFTAQEQAKSYEEAIDRCVSRLRRQVMKYKGKRQRSG